MNGSLPELGTALVVAIMLMLLMRWVFKPSRPPRSAVPGDATPGLLVTVASDLSRTEAMQRRAALGEAGIRTNLTRAAGDRFEVRVFAADQDQARQILD